jgi:rod shape-determining protein MreB
LEEELTMEMRGRNLLTGLPQSVKVSSIEIREAIAQQLQTIVEVVKDAIDDTPPELVADLMDQGIMLAGGGALLRGLPRRLSEETKMTVKVAKHPMACVARGAGLVLEDLDRLAPILASTQRAALTRR